MQILWSSNLQVYERFFVRVYRQKFTKCSQTTPMTDVQYRITNLPYLFNLSISYWPNHKTVTRDINAGLSCVHLWNFPHVQLFSFTSLTTGDFFCSSSYLLMSTSMLPLGFRTDPLYYVPYPMAFSLMVLPELEYNGVSSWTAFYICVRICWFSYSP